MCLRCRGTFVQGQGIDQQIDLKNSMFCHPCALKSFTKCGRLLSRIGYEVWVLLFQYCGMTQIYNLQNTCKILSNRFKFEQSWLSFLSQLSKHYPHVKCDELGVFALMPNVECPDNWKQYSRYCAAKIDWLRCMEQNTIQLPKFYKTFKSLGKSNFGVSRMFSANTVHVIFGLSSFVTTAELYNNIENFMLNSNSQTTSTLFTGAILQYYCSSITIEASTGASTGAGAETRPLLSQPVPEVVQVQMCVITSLSDQPMVTFSDMGEALILGAQKMTTMKMTTAARCNSESSTVNEKDAMIGLKYGGTPQVTLCKPQLVMPFETYIIHWVN